MIAVQTGLMLLVAWVAMALALGVLIGLGIRLADRRTADEATWLDDQPQEVLAPAEVARRAERLEAWL